jgi:hypothetical protein
MPDPCELSAFALFFALARFPGENPYPPGYLASARKRHENKYKPQALGDRIDALLMTIEATPGECVFCAGIAVFSVALNQNYKGLCQAPR